VGALMVRRSAMAGLAMAFASLLLVAPALGQPAASIAPAAVGGLYRAGLTAAMRSGDGATSLLKLLPALASPQRGSSR
jgi:hypothetical protein